MGLYEHLPDGMREVVDEIVECLALMSISFNDQWRAQAIARMDREPDVFDRLCSAYPDWGDNMDDLVEADRKRPVRKRP